MTTRRTFLAGSLTFPALAVLGGGDAGAQQSAAIGAIRVDVSRLATQGWGSNALAIKLGMERELATALGPALRRGAGPTLNVAIRNVFLNSYAGGGGGGGRVGSGASQSSDSFDSEATLVGRGNRVIATYPVLSTVPSSAAGPWYLPDIDDRRLEGLIRHNAAWIKRYVAG
jgi:hypothetical protein